ncbi:MAG: hypothetical protein JSS00_01285 [Proteobacteria bacterium]|nr:hypothetical protein [Pseudomonadota bacterium]
MKTAAIIVVAALALAACGRSGGGHGGPTTAADNAACALIGDGAQIFGAGAQHFGYPRLDTFAGSCEFNSADGKRGGEIILYTSESLHGVTPQAQMQTIAAAWSHQTQTPLAAVNGLGDAAQIAIDLPGYQTQIAFRKGGSLVLISARSGEASVTGEQLARNMAAAAAANLH